MTLMDEISFVLGLIPLNSTNTTKIPSPTCTFSNMCIQIYVSNVIGIPINLLIMYLSFTDKTIKKKYIYLLGNIAICNFFILVSNFVSNLVHNYVIDNDLLFTPFLCTLYEIWAQTFTVCYYNSISLVSIHRYMIVVNEMDRVFTNKIILCMCLSVYWPILYPILAFGSPTHLVIDYCGYMYWFPFIREFLLVPAGILNIVSVFYIIKLFRFLRKEMKTTTLRRDASRLKDERSLLIAMTVQGILPLVCHVPTALVMILCALLKNCQNQSWNIFGITVLELIVDITGILYFSLTALDGLLTLYCIRPFRKIIVGWWRNHLQNKSTVQSLQRNQ